MRAQGSPSPQIACRRRAPNPPANPSPHRQARGSAADHCGLTGRRQPAAVRWDRRQWR